MAAVSVVQMEIEERLRSHAAALSRRDMDAALELFASDAVMKPANTEPLCGAQELREFFERLFAAMHIEPARIAATFVLGLAAGALVLRTGSVWPAITLHAVNNAVTILVATGHLDAVAAALHRHPQAGLTVAIGGAAAGLGVATWARPARSRRS